MKNFLLTIGFACMMGISSLSAQNVKGIFKAIKANNVTSVSENFTSDIELCIKNNPDFYTKAEAMKKIKSFLSDVEVKSVKEIHSGKSEDNANYWVAKMTTSKGTYRVFLYSENNKVIEIRFDDF